MEKFSKETPNYHSNNVFARLSEPRLSLSRAAAPPTTEIPPLNCVVQRKI